MAGTLDGFGLLALNVPPSLPVPGLYSTVTVHDFLGPRLLPLHTSAVIVNGPGSGETVTVSAAEAEPPEFVSVNSCATAFTWAPKSNVPPVAGDQLSEGRLAGGLAACPPVVPSNAAAASDAATMTRTKAA
jgi:hypothetical protein